MQNIAAKVGIDLQGAVDVGRDINLRDDIDIALTCILNQLAALILRVMTAVWRAVPEPGTAQGRLWAPATFLCQFGQGFHFETPTVVVCEMPVKLITTMQRQYIEVALDEVNIEEMARAIEMSPTVGEARFIGDRREREFDVTARSRTGFDGQALAERLCSAEEADGLARLNADTILRDSYRVGFFLLGRQG